MKKILIIIILGIAAYAGFQYITTTNTEEVSEVQDVQREEVSDIEFQVIPENAYIVEPQSSSIVWEGKKPGANHVGTINISSGYLTEDYQGEFIIDMDSVSSEDGQRLINHLKGEDFFDVNQYPYARLVVSEFTQGVLQGTLAVRGITKDIEIPAIITREEDTLSIISDHSIDRTDYGITFRSGSFFENLGDSLINDLVDLNIEVSAQR